MILFTTLALKFLSIDTINLRIIGNKIFVVGLIVCVQVCCCYMSHLLNSFESNIICKVFCLAILGFIWSTNERSCDTCTLLPCEWTDGTKLSIILNVWCLLWPIRKFTIVYHKTTFLACLQIIWLGYSNAHSHFSINKLINSIWNDHLLVHISSLMYHPLLQSCCTTHYV